MIVSIIVAMDRNRGIGIDNRLPWRLSSDLVRFKNLTMGHHVLMGRKTYESINKVLPGRIMVVISRNEQYNAPGCITVKSLDQGLELARNQGDQEAFIIGGESIYRSALVVAQRIYLTQVHAQVVADAFFPEIDEGAWQETQMTYIPKDEKNQYDSTFRILDKIER